MQKTRNKKIEKDITKSVMEKIETDKIVMRPKSYFLLKSIILGVTVGAMLLFLTLSMNIILYRLKVLGSFEFLELGKLGLGAFWGSLPVRYILLAILFFVLSYRLLSNYDFSYKKNFTGILISVFIALLVIAWGLDRFKFENFAIRQPYLSGAYKVPHIGENWAVGEVFGVENQTFDMVTPLGEEMRVRYSKDTIFQNIYEIAVGDRVRVVGERNGDVMNADVIARPRMMQMQTPQHMQRQPRFGPGK